MQQNPWSDHMELAPYQSFGSLPLEKIYYQQIHLEQHLLKQTCILALRLD
jgi:hypothetical protein